jgi:hypothetical protein
VAEGVTGTGVAVGAHVVGVDVRVGVDVGLGWGKGDAVGLDVLVALEEGGRVFAA